jgi:hypothetical protein
MQPFERIIPVAQQLLTIPIDEEHGDLWLWERAERVFGLSQTLVHLPEIASQAIDSVAVGAAALFHCAAWVAQVEQGRLTRWQVLARPTSDIQRELSAAILQERAGHLLPPKTARLAADAIRHCNDRGATLIEAQVLAEAESLDDLSALYVLRQFRQYQAESRPLKQLVATWQRQQEYRYWDLRVTNGLRFETTRRLARARLAAVDGFMQALACDLDGADLAAAIERAVADPPARSKDAERRRTGPAN